MLLQVESGLDQTLHWHAIPVFTCQTIFIMKYVLAYIAIIDLVVRYHNGVTSKSWSISRISSPSPQSLASLLFQID